MKSSVLVGFHAADPRVTQHTRRACRVCRRVERGTRRFVWRTARVEGAALRRAIEIDRQFRRRFIGPGVGATTHLGMMKTAVSLSADTSATVPLAVRRTRFGELLALAARGARQIIRPDGEPVMLADSPARLFASSWKLMDQDRPHWGNRNSANLSGGPPKSSHRGIFTET